MKPIIGVVYGSDSDLPTMKEGLDFLKKQGVPFETTIVSAHRTPDRLFEYAKAARKKGLKVIIAGAGGSAHLPGMIASLTPLPVIGVPVQSKALSGVDSLHSIVQMPPGIPVATVAIGGALNAAILAVSILGISDTKYLDKIEAYKKELENIVLEKCDKIEKLGYEKY